MGHVVASIDQDAYRWRNDDGSETAATWLEALNTSHLFDVAAGNVQTRLRILIEEQNGAMSANFDAQLEYDVNGSGIWNDVTLTSSVVRAFNSAFLSDGSDTTQQIGAGSFVTPNAGQSETGLAGGGALDFAGSDETELDYALEFIAADLSDGDSVIIRVQAVDSWLNQAAVTIAKAAATNITGISQSLTLSENTGTVSNNITIAGIAAALVIAVGVGTVTLPGETNVTGISQSLTLSANTGTVAADTTVAGITQALTLTENTGAVAQASAITISGITSSLLVMTYTGTITHNVNVPGITQSLTLTENVGSLPADIAGITQALILSENTGIVGQDLVLTGISQALTITENTGSVSNNVPKPVGMGPSIVSGGFGHGRTLAVEGFGPYNLPYQHNHLDLRVQVQDITTDTLDLKVYADFFSVDALDCRVKVRDEETGFLDLLALVDSGDIDIVDLYADIVSGDIDGLDVSVVVALTITGITGLQYAVDNSRLHFRL